MKIPPPQRNVFFISKQQGQSFPNYHQFDLSIWQPYSSSKIKTPKFTAIFKRNQGAIRKHLFVINFTEATLVVFADDYTAGGKNSDHSEDRHNTQLNQLLPSIRNLVQQYLVAKSTQASASLTLNAIQKLIIASGLTLQHHQRPSIKIVNESKKSHGESKSPKSTAAAQIRKILQEIDHINARGGFYSPSQLHEQMNMLLSKSKCKLTN